MANFSRLSASWLEWSGLSRLAGASVSVNCEDCRILFASHDYSVHLRNDSAWWIIDTVDDRGQRQDDTARLSDIELTEKYLIWTWASHARGAVGAERLGPQFY